MRAALSLTNGKCATCGAAFSEMHANLGSETNEAAQPAAENVAAPLSSSRGSPYQIHAIAVIAVAGLALFGLELIARRYSTAPIWLAACWIVFLLTLVPLASGSALILICGANTPKWMETFASWMDQRTAKANSSSGRFNEYVVSPTLMAYEALVGLSNKVSNSILRNGAKAATNVFAISLFFVLLWVAYVIVVLFVFFLIAGFLIEAFSNKDTDKNEGSETGSRERTIYSGTNVFNEQITGRVDSDGNIYEGSTIFNEKLVGRVDADGNRYEGSNIFNENKIGRTDKDGNIFKGTNIFNEQKIGRVDEDGNRYEGTNIFNERKIGSTRQKGE